MTKHELIQQLQELPDNDLPIYVRKLRKPPNHTKPSPTVPVLRVAVADDGTVVLDASEVPIPVPRAKLPTLAERLRAAIPVGQPISVNDAASLLNLDPKDNQTRVQVAQSLNRLVLCNHAKRAEAAQDAGKPGPRTKYLYTILA